MNMKIKIRYKTIPTILIYVQLFYVSIVCLLVDAGFSNSITTVCDGINIILMIYMLKFYGKVRKSQNLYKTFIICYLLFFIFGTLSSLINGFKFIQWIWSIRNFGRFFIFFNACCIFLELNDVERIKKIIYILGHVNFIIALVQFILLGKSGDYIGGLFGTSGGVANTWLNVFLVANIVIQFSEWLLNKNKIRQLIFSLVEGICIAVIAELKFYYIEVLILVAIGFIVCKKNKKSIEKLIIIVCLAIAVLSISVPFLYKLFPNFEKFFSLEVILKTATSSYTGSGDLGRLTAIYEIASKIFKNDFLKIFLGIGLGNGEYSGTFKELQSDFYFKYLYTKYFWFTDAIIMVQNGLMGIVLYIGAFWSIIKSSARQLKNEKQTEVQLISLLMGLAGLMLFIYNVSLNTESAYIYYLVLSFGIIEKKTSRRGKKGDT